MLFRVEWCEILLGEFRTGHSGGNGKQSYSTEGYCYGAWCLKHWFWLFRDEIVQGKGKLANGAIRQEFLTPKHLLSGTADADTETDVAGWCITL